jgi:hypothetical protein
MQTDGTYTVVRCGRCSMIHPHDYRLCPRCGAADPRVSYVSRKQVESASLEFLVRAEAVALPPEKVARLGARIPAASPAFTPMNLLVEIGRKVQTVLTAVRARPAV